MNVKELVEVKAREQWRAWLEENHAAKKETWLVADLRKQATGISYLDAVEEALCFGWTELNKERARRLIAAGRMTAGEKVLPDLSPSGFVVPGEIEEALQAEPGAWEFFSSRLPLFQRVRAGYVAEQRQRPAEFAANRMFGNWDDSGLARSPAPPVLG